MFPLCFRLCQKGKEYKINSWIFFIPNFGIFIPKFPLSLPSSTDNSPGDRGLCLSPCSRGMWSKMWVLGWESGKGHSTLALQQSQITSPLATDILSLVYTVPQRSIQSYFIYTRQPWLVSLGEGHFIHKNASFSFLKKKKKRKRKMSESMEDGRRDGAGIYLIGWQECCLHGSLGRKCPELMKMF